MWLAVKARPLWGVWLETAAAPCPCRSRAWWRRGPPGVDQFFSVSFLLKNHWFSRRANQWPLIGETLFSSVPPSNSLVSVSDPRRAFWADTVPFSGPRLASCVASGTTEKQGHRQVCCDRREVQGHHQKQLMQTLIVRLNALFYTRILVCEKSTE